jgi:hypothetical protein
MRKPAGETSMVRVPLLRGAEFGERDDGKKGSVPFFLAASEKIGTDPEANSPLQVLYCQLYFAVSNFWGVLALGKLRK